MMKHQFHATSTLLGYQKKIEHRQQSNQSQMYSDWTWKLMPPLTLYANQSTWRCSKKTYWWAYWNVKLSIFVHHYVTGQRTELARWRIQNIEPIDTGATKKSPESGAVSYAVYRMDQFLPDEWSSKKSISFHSIQKISYQPPRCMLECWLKSKMKQIIQAQHDDTMI